MHFTLETLCRYTVSTIKPLNTAFYNDSLWHQDSNHQMFSIVFRYVESAQSLGKETNIDLSKYEVADNVDLETVLMEYESYYFIKFSKYPKIAKRLNPNGMYWYGSHNGWYSGIIVTKGLL